jgi:acyl transferase domain-containing protein
MSDVPSADSRTDLEIAIIGMAGRFPGARGVRELWQNLRERVESITFFSDEELLKAGIDRSLLSNPYYIKAGALLDAADQFDAGFFGYSPRDAELIDPQQRLFLECAYHALEDAGYDASRYPGPIGVYAGTTHSSYFHNLLASNPEQVESIGNYSLMIGNDPDYLAPRVSYKLDLHGPGIVVQTACSTSLVAVHLACQGLLSGDCDVALAGGVCLYFPQISGYLYEPHGILSSDGHCRAFDAKATGTVFGRGVGIVVLKRLNEALADRDHVYAVIKGTALNNDGLQKVGFTAPRVDGQAAVIEAAQRMAGVEPESITYIETHGTGTELGDPIEIAALSRAFRKRTDKKGFCAIGSVKTNIGHTDAAAGVASLIKTALSLYHKELVPSLHFEKPNPQIDFENSPFYVNTTLKGWEAEGLMRRAGVSSFGIGGTNAHVILEEAPPPAKSGPSRGQQLILLSAKTAEALAEASTKHSRFVKEHPDVNPADLAYTLNVGRKAHPHRMYTVCQNAEELVAALEAPGANRSRSAVAAPVPPRAIFMFTGQGSQYVNMGRDLYLSETGFRRQVDQCCDLLIPELDLDLRSILFPPQEDAESAAELLQQTWLTQPALFTIEYALAQLWMHWGLQPSGMIGHSIGEYVAACIAGIFSLEDALRLVAARGRLMQSCAAGAMTAVPMAESDVQGLLGGKLELAAVNAPSLCVVSGSIPAIEEFERRLRQEGAEARRLRTSHAFHSAMMEPILGEFEKAFATVRLSPPMLPLVSNLSGTWITPEQAVNPGYWAAHLRRTVRFSNGIQVLLEDPNRVLLEIGPGQTLANLAGSHTTGPSLHRPLATMRRADEKQSDDKVILETLGMLWLKGMELDWAKFYEEENRARIPLPAYSFQHQRYWLEASRPQARTVPASVPSGHKADISEWLYIPSWKRTLPLAAVSQLAPGTCWLVFVDECGTGAAVRNRLDQLGQDVVSVSIGQQFASLSDRSYTIRPSHREDYEMLLSKLQASGKSLHKIVHCWTVSREVPELSTSQTFQEIQERGFYSLLFLAQSLSRLNMTHPIELAVVSSGLHEVTAAAERVSPAKATLLGPCKVIPQELPNITCRSIDISGDVAENQMNDHLMSEIASSPGDRIVAYRGGHRWIQIFDQVKTDVPDTSNCRLREKGVYLITGGLGEAGLALAEVLARSVHANLVLVGRSGLPAREQWRQWLATHDHGDEVSCKILRVQALEDLGAEVLLECADVADEEQMREVVLRAKKRFGSLHGVIYAAGLFVNAQVQDLSPDQCKQQFHAKVSGLPVLQKVLESMRLDFCVVNSSLSSILGGQGLAAYAAAHLFVDAFTQEHNKRHAAPWVNIGWDRWQAAEADQLEAGGAGRLTELAINRAEAGEVLLRTLSMGGSPQVAVSTSDLSIRINRWINLASVREGEHAVDAETAALHPRPALSCDYVAPANPTETSLADIWQQLLGVDKVGIHDNFFDLGGHSLLGTQLLSRIRAAFHIQMPLRTLYESPTVAAMAESIACQQLEQEKLDQMELLRKIELMAEDEVEAELGKGKESGTGVEFA